MDLESRHVRAVSDVEAETSETDDAATEAALKREAACDKEVRAILRKCSTSCRGLYLRRSAALEIRELPGAIACHQA